MPGPVPAPDSQRRRRNATVAMTQLPMEGYAGEIPDWPLETATEAELWRWEQVWRSPAAALWVRMGPATYLLVARYVRDALIVENDSHTTVAIAHLHAEVRQLEDRLGLSPLAMLRLRWEIVADEVEEKRKPASRGRKLRAVDADAG
jgi:hypothetical protein